MKKKLNQNNFLFNYYHIYIYIYINMTIREFIVISGLSYDDFLTFHV